APYHRSSRNSRLRLRTDAGFSRPPKTRNLTRWNARSVQVDRAGSTKTTVEDDVQTRERSYLLGGGLMRLKHVVHFALIVLLAGGFASSLWAQKAELYGYGGFFWPNKTPVVQLGSDGIYGIKLGGYMTPHAQLEGNFGYINHFDLDRDPSPIAGALGIVRPAVRAITYDLNGSWNFSQRSLGGARVTPYVTV